MNTHMAVNVKYTNIVEDSDHIKDGKAIPAQPLGVIQSLLAHMGKALSLEYVVNQK